MGYWYSNSDDIAVSTRIRLARNLNGIPFHSKMTAEQFETVNNSVKKALFESGNDIANTLKFINMEDVPEIERFSMVERHIISRDFALNYKNRAIIISDDESICIMLGEEDHIRIQVILGGLQLDKAYTIAQSIDDILCSNLNIAFDERLGFLTECPTNLGTGLRASVMLHLPITENSGEIRAIADSVNKLGLTVRGMYGEGSKAVASFYQLSNQITLGITEKNAIDNLKIITEQLIEKERLCREKLSGIKMEDISMRALGVLQNARILSSEEMMKRISEIKLGMSTGLIKLSVSPIELMIEGQPYMIMRKYGEISSEERDIKRAKQIRESLT